MKFEYRSSLGLGYKQWKQELKSLDSAIGDHKVVMFSVNGTGDRPVDPLRRDWR